jgi:hydroxymethylglutaryl-CoA lyase
MVTESLQLVECPRDAMQGLHEFIATEKKVAYINQLLKVGFHTLDCGSFVSEKAIPQLRDTAEVLHSLDLADARTRLLTIVANEKGAERAADFDIIQYLGYPFSISETFQQRNTNASIAESLERVAAIKRMADEQKKELVVYISMGFGNPYGDVWSPQLATDWCKRLYEEIGVEHLAMSDTIGVGSPEVISSLFTQLIPALPAVNFGAHLHTTPDTWKPKVEAAWNAGCRRFDGALKGFGGCPMAADELTGNMPMENLVSFLDEQNVHSGIDREQLTKAMMMASEVFPH